MDGFKYRPFGKDFENIGEVLALGGLLISNFTVVFDSQKQNLETIQNEKKNGIH
tara:strand:+ start:400 stop:561 length:162 start_codon:yes stop_codon:yes gene_type:complete